MPEESIECDFHVLVDLYPASVFFLRDVDGNYLRDVDDNYLGLDE